MLRSLMTISGFTLMSRVLGLLRDQLMFIMLGANSTLDAFTAAFRFPNMGRRIFGEGAFNSAFVPLYGQTIEQEDKISSDRFASLAFTWLTAILGVLSIIIIIGMKWFMAFFVPGFLEGYSDVASWGYLDGRTWEWVWEQVKNPRGTENFYHTVEIGRIMFCYLLCMALGAQLSGVLNTRKRFAIAAFAPVLLNIIALLGFAYIWFYGINSEDLAGKQRITFVLSWCVFLAGWAQLAILFYGVKREGVHIRAMIPKMTPKMKQLFKLMVPGIAAASVQQINLLVSTQIASTQDEAISYIYAADRLNQFPLGMIGIALGISLLPEISRHIGASNLRAASESLGNGVKIALLLTIPAAVALGVIPHDLVNAMFGYGNFDENDVNQTANVLAAFSFGMPAYVLIRVLQPGFFARKDTKRPMRYGIVMVIVNIILSFMLFPTYKHVGLGIATSIAGWVNVLLLLIGLKGFFHVDKALWGKIGRILLASAVMAVTIYTASHFCQHWISGNIMQRVSSLAVIVLTGLSAYAIAALFLKATSVSELKGFMRRG